MAEWVKKIEENAKGLIAEAEQELTALEGVDTVDLSDDAQTDDAQTDGAERSNAERSNAERSDEDGTEPVTSDDAREQVSD